MVRAAFTPPRLAGLLGLALQSRLDSDGFAPVASSLGGRGRAAVQAPTSLGFAPASTGAFFDESPAEPPSTATGYRASSRRAAWRNEVARLERDWVLEHQHEDLKRENIELKREVQYLKNLPRENKMLNYEVATIKAERDLALEKQEALEAENHELKLKMERDYAALTSRLAALEKQQQEFYSKTTGLAEPRKELHEEHDDLKSMTRELKEDVETLGQPHGPSFRADLMSEMSNLRAKEWLHEQEASSEVEGEQDEHVQNREREFDDFVVY